jgi:23S rRNA pseudouridine1911/1915/1917 synthase
MPLVTQSTRVADEQPTVAARVVLALTGLSNNKVRGLFDHNCVTVNGQPCGEPRTPVQPGDEIVVRYDPQQGYPVKKRAWTDPSFSIVYEDPQIIVVNKSANILTVATERGGEQNTLENRVSHYFKHTGRRRTAMVVHRLDRGVSGLLVFAKSHLIAQALQEQFKARKPERLYMAIVAGQMKQPGGTFRSHMGTGKNLVRFSTRDETKGELAITHYRVQQHLADTTVVEVRLETGRRNQIRVHFAEHGHPVLGDPRYGSGRSKHERWPPERIALHAITLGFDHPTSGKPLKFVSELPQSMQRFIGGSGQTGKAKRPDEPQSPDKPRAPKKPRRPNNSRSPQRPRGPR